MLALFITNGLLAQLVERYLDKVDVTSSSLVQTTIIKVTHYPSSESFSSNLSRSKISPGKSLPQISLTLPYFHSLFAR